MTRCNESITPVHPLNDENGSSVVKFNFTLITLLKLLEKHIMIMYFFLGSSHGFTFTDRQGAVFMHQTASGLHFFPIGNLKALTSEERQPYCLNF